MFVFQSVHCCTCLPVCTAAHSVKNIECFSTDEFKDCNSNSDINVVHNVLQDMIALNCFMDDAVDNKVIAELQKRKLLFSGSLYPPSVVNNINLNYNYVSKSTSIICSNKYNNGISNDYCCRQQSMVHPPHSKKVALPLMFSNNSNSNRMLLASKKNGDIRNRNKIHGSTAVLLTADGEHAVIPSMVKAKYIRNETATRTLNTGNLKINETAADMNIIDIVSNSSCAANGKEYEDYNSPLPMLADVVKGKEEKSSSILMANEMNTAMHSVSSKSNNTHWTESGIPAFIDITAEDDERVDDETNGNHNNSSSNCNTNAIMSEFVSYPNTSLVPCLFTSLSLQPMPVYMYIKSTQSVIN